MKLTKKRAGAVIVIVTAIVLIITGGEEQEFTHYIPSVSGLDRCGTINPKRAVALSNAELGHYPALLCLSATGLYHLWKPEYGPSIYGTQVSVIWSHVKNGWDYVAAWKLVVPANYTGYVLWANEPDQAGQANLTIAQLVTMFINISTYCPNCKFVGPMFSTADDGNKVKQFITACNANPSCNLSKIYAWSLHVYPRPAKNWSPSARVDDLCNIIGQIYCNRKIWLTEIGYTKLAPNHYSTFYTWIKDAQSDPQIEQIFLYSTFQPPSSQFQGALLWGGNDLTDIGRAWRDANLPQPYP